MSPPGHRTLPGLHLRLPHDGEPVRHRLDPGVGPATEGIRTREQRHHSSKSEAHWGCLEALREPMPHLMEDSGDAAETAEDNAADKDRMADEEREE